ncbi:Type II secretion system protein [Burkholderia dolosa AU0158]|nr:Type II secretion system protein [Burkholderia dolosa AU0158]
MRSAFIDSPARAGRTRGGRLLRPRARQPPGAPRPVAQQNAAATRSSGPIGAHGYAAAAEYLSNVASRAGIDDARGKALAVLAVLIAFAAIAGSHGGLLACFAALALGGAIVGVWLASRIQRRRLKIVRQIPSFLDGIVRLVTLGNSVPAAFQSALLTTEEPLRSCLDDVSRMLRGGVEIDRAMMHVAKVYRTDESRTRRLGAAAVGQIRRPRGRDARAHGRVHARPRTSGARAERDVVGDAAVGVRARDAADRDRQLRRDDKPEVPARHVERSERPHAADDRVRAAAGRQRVALSNGSAQVMR